MVGDGEAGVAGPDGFRSFASCGESDGKAKVGGVDRLVGKSAAIAAREL